MYKTILLNILILISYLGFSQKLSFIFPNNNYTTADSSITFKWNYQSLIGYSYNLQISSDTTFATILADTNFIPTNICKIDTFTFNSKYYCRVRAFDGTNYTNWSNYRSFFIFSPNSINSIGLWLDADTSNITFESGKVKEWKDLSPNQNNLIQNDNSLQPLWTDSLINNKPCVSFTSANEYMDFTDSIEKVGITIYSIAKNKELTYGSYILGKSDISAVGLFFNLGNTNFKVKNNRNINFNHQNYMDFVYIKSLYDTLHYGDYWQSYFAKLQVNSEISDSVSMYGYPFICDRLGYAYWYGTYKKFNGELAELIIYYSPIKDSLNYLNEQYLRYKYAPPANLGYDIHVPYGFCDTTIDAGARFTNYLWSTGDTTQTISVNQPGQYSVTVTDIFGFESSDSLMVYYPKINQQLADTLICFGDTIKWNAGLQDTNYTFLWQDNITTDSIMPISQAGEYYVQITDSFGCVYNSDTAYISIDHYPETITLGNDTSLCAGQSLYLQTGASQTANYLWNNGDTTDYTVINTAGNYSVTATNTIGCVATDTINIQTHGQAPIIGFSYLNTCFNDITIFTDTSFTTDNSNIISWQWSFGNGDSAIQQNPAIQYNDTGTYNITLQILTDSNCTNIISKNIKINPLPTSDFNYTNPCSKDSIYFSDNSTIINDTIVSWLWIFGNGTFSSDKNSYTVFDTSQTYNISLITTTNNNCKDTVTKSILIKKSPSSNFSASNTCKNSSTIFINQTPDEGIWQVISSNWNFGDGGTSTLTNPTYSYATNDTFNVTLTTKLINGCSNTITKPIIIYDNPVSNFVTDTVLCVNSYINFIDSSKSDVPIVNRYWEFDSLFTSTAKNPQIIFADTGQYTVGLSVTSEQGCKGYSSKNIKINNTPNASFYLESLIGVTPFNVKPVIVDSLSSSYWDFGDGYFSTDNFVNHTYIDSGSFVIKLIKTNIYGCKDSSSLIIKSIVPLIDLSIYDAQYLLKNNSLTTSADLINLGTLPINKIELFLNIDNGSTIKEIWTGTLNSGQILHYDFSTIYQLPEYQDVKFECISANPVFDNYYDNNVTNNEKCLSFDNNFNLLNPYPNPADKSINFQIIVPKSDNLELSIYDNTGKIIDKYYVNANAGYNRFLYNLSNLRKGDYTLRVKYNDTEKITKFFVN